MSENKVYDKIDGFIRKYYQNELLKGLLIFSSILLLAYFLVTSFEYFGRLSSFYRTILFYGFVGLMGFYFYQKVLTPVFKLFRIQKGLSQEEAAVLIGKHFKSVDDKLLNTLQLLKQSSDNELLLASIHQKELGLKDVPFEGAVNLKENKKYLKYLLPLVFVLLLVGILSPSLFKEGTERLIFHQQEFAIPAPFTFELDVPSLNVPKNKDLTIGVKIDGDEIPNAASIVMNEVSYKMSKENATYFQFPLKSVQQDFSFYFTAAGFNSDEYEIKTYALPQVHQFNLYADYPGYTQETDQKYSNVGTLIVPEGTTLSWEFFGKDMDQLAFVVDSNRQELRKADERFTHELNARKGFNYKLISGNQNISDWELFEYEIEVVKDQSPSIKVVQDEQIENVYSGVIRDDYGFTKLQLVIKQGDDERVEPIKFRKEGNVQTFSHRVDQKNWKVEEGEQVTYFFRVYDNDGVNGAKYTDSDYYFYTEPTKEEVRKEISEQSEAVKSDFQQEMKSIKEIDKEIKDFMKDLQDKKEVSWEDKQRLQKLLEKQMNLEKELKNISKNNKENNEKRNELTPKEEELLKKQEQIEKLFDQVFDEETKKMIEEIQRMMEELNKEELQEKLSEMEMSNEDMEKELDRTLELFKQLEFEMKLEETIDQLEELQKKQEELSEQTENAKKEELDDLKKEQEKLEEEFKNVEKSLEDLKKKNEELKKPNQMADTKEQQEKTKEQQQESKDNMDKGNKKKASDNQKKASEEMKKMMDSLSMMQKQNQQQKQQENMDDLRLLLDNLIETSFQQENLQEKLLNTHYNDPKYPQIKLAQSNIRDETILIADSLYALSARVPELESIVNKEMSLINSNLTLALEDLNERKKGDASSRQQYVMTSLNNLALILDEVLQQMQEQMKKDKFGNSSCDKPGGAPKPSFGNASQMQQKLNQQMKQMMEEMMKKQGESPGGKEGEKDGEGNGNGNGEMNKKIAKLAAEQGAIREQVQKLMKELAKKQAEGGNGNGELDKLLEEMEKTERDLYNKDFSLEMMQRQQEILTRLLEAEKAEREQDWDDKRESEEGQKTQDSNLNDFLEYKRLKEREAELLKSIPPSLKPFYKEKANEYLNNVEEQE